MLYKNVQSFIQGIFEKEGIEAKIADQFLLKCQNASIDIAGRIKSRYGYEYWQDLLDENSITSSQNLPVVASVPGGAAGFGNRIQKILQYTDVAGASYMIIVCQGKIYIETVEDNGRQWSCLTPNFTFEVIDRHLDIVSYLDLVFFNDVAHNVYYYDSQSYVAGQGWITLGNRFIYFAGDTIYYRSYSDFSADFSILIENGNVNNPQGQEIYDGLNNITYPYLASLNLGYCIRTGTDDTGFKYYVLDNAKNQRADNKCQIIKFNDRLIAEDYVEFDINANAEILNFAYHVGEFEVFGNLYIFVEDGKIYKIDEANLQADLLGNDSAFFTAPVNIAGKKQYSIAASEKGIFVYTKTLPDKSDWYQPVMLRNIALKGLNPYNPTYGASSTWLARTDARTWTGRGSIKYASARLTKNIFINYGANFTITEESRMFYKTPNYHVYTANSFISGTTGAYVPAAYVNSFSIRKTISDSIFPSTTWKTYTLVPTPAQNVRVFMARYFSKSYVNYSLGAYTYLQTDPWDITQPTLEYDYFYYSSTGWQNLLKTIYQEVTAGSDITVERINTNCFDLIGSSFNPDHFISKTLSKIILAAGIDFNGNLKVRDFETIDEGIQKVRYIYPCGAEFNHVKIQPMSFTYNNELIFGSWFGTIVGQTFKINFDTWELSRNGGTQSRIMNIEDDNRFIYYNHTSNKYEISNTVFIAQKITGFADWNTHLTNYNSNLVFHIYKQTIDSAGNNQVDKIQKIGSPNVPQLSVGYDAASTLTSGKMVKYFTAFQFASGKTSPLSLQSFELSIINNTSQVVITGLNTFDVHGYEIYAKADVSKIQIYRSQINSTDPSGVWTTPNLIATLEKDPLSNDDWYADVSPHTLPKETFIDSADTYVYNPWTTNNEITYPVRDIFLHKSRLILLNKLNEVNSNTAMYSDLDRARAIPPSNTRDIESGDGDYLIGGISSGDYAYLFKETKIYGILGDFPTGQLVDISRTIGTRYKNMKTVYGGACYFMNDNGIYKIQGANPPEILVSERVGNYFDKRREDCIDFNNLEEHGFVNTDVENRELRFHVPQKKEGVTVIKNNLVIVYNIDYNFFKTIQYNDNIYGEAYCQNILSNEYEYLLASYEGNIFKLANVNNDNNNSIHWVVRTKEFNVGSDAVRKIFKTIEVYGNYLRDLHVAYWVDGKRYEGELFQRRTMRGLDSKTAKIWSEGKASRIMIEISGEQLNQPPTEIDEINIGYTQAKGMR